MLAFRKKYYYYYHYATTKKYYAHMYNKISSSKCTAMLITANVAPRTSFGSVPIFQRQGEQERRNSSPERTMDMLARHRPVPTSEMIIAKLQAEEALHEASAAERAHKKQMADQRAAKQAVLEKARQAEIKEEFNDKERVYKMCEIGDSEGLWSLLRKIEREQESSLSSAGGVKSLVEATTPDGATPLYYACKGGFVECAKVLLGFGATTRSTQSGGFSPLWVACARGKFECVDYCPFSYLLPPCRVLRSKRGWP